MVPNNLVCCNVLVFIGYVVFRDFLHPYERGYASGMTDWKRQFAYRAFVTTLISSRLNFAYAVIRIRQPGILGHEKRASAYLEIFSEYVFRM
jgi:hypothetical protein